VTGRSKSLHDLTVAADPMVFVIDDDEAMCETLSSLFRSVNLKVEVFGSAHHFFCSRPAAHERHVILRDETLASAKSDCTASD
jgi:FixJ family two-component response regulator